TGNPGAEPNRDVRFDKASRLLDMHFDKSVDLGRIEVALAAAQGVRVAAALGDMFGERAAAVHAPDVERAIRKHAKGATASKIRYLEPDALLGANGHYRDVARGRQTHFFDGRDSGQSGQHAGCAVEVATTCHAIEMRAGDDRRQRAVTARQRHVGVGSGVGTNLETEIRSAS